MPKTLNAYLRKRAKDLNLSMSALCEKAGMSRQTLYSLSDASKVPTLPTLVALAQALHVHPMRLLQLLFDSSDLVRPSANQKQRGDHSAFVRDITYADGALVQPGQTFTKTWELQNVGKVVWEDRFLQCVDEEIVVYARSGEVLRIAENLKPTVSKIPVPLTQPGESVRLSATFTAPTSVGVVLSYWKSVFADGRPCFPKSPGLWVKVRVSSIASTANNESEEGD